MKIWPRLIGVVIVLALFCSPGLAISASELISRYQTPQFIVPIPTPNLPDQGVLPFPTPTPLPSDGVPVPTVSPWKHDLFTQLVKQWKVLPTDIPSRKPNIYLYSDKDITARVRLAPEYAITVSEPAYPPGKGWLAEIRNGSLNGGGDFLFYEALVPDSGWQKEEGYVIRAEYREQDMATALGNYGFNEKETGDFIEYWASHLAGDTDSVFYPQETDAVNRVMPLSISPEPDHVSRIWFYAEPLVSAPDQVTNPERIVREGFHVVEWGVMIRDE